MTALSASRLAALPALPHTALLLQICCGGDDVRFARTSGSTFRPHGVLLLQGFVVEDDDEDDIGARRQPRRGAALMLDDDDDE